MATNIQLSHESLCDGLDQLCIQRLELMDQLIRSNMMLESSMRGGFFMLSKTRYNLGNKAVSALQLPNEGRDVDALATVVTSPVPLDGYDGDLLYQQVETKFEDPVITFEEEDYGQQFDNTFSDAGTDNEGLRRRQHTDTTEIEDINEDHRMQEESKVEPMQCSSSDRIKTINRDPIRWFTALPPQTLRRAQSEFKTALNVTSQCATLQTKLRAVNKEYSRLSKIKSKLERMEKEP